MGVALATWLVLNYYGFVVVVVVIIISRVALSQASVSGLCDGTCRPVCLSVGLYDFKVYCGKTAEWIRMMFGTVSGVGRKMGVLDGGGDRQRRRGSFGSEFGASHCNQWRLCDAALPKLLRARLVIKTTNHARMIFHPHGGTPPLGRSF